VFIDTAKAQDGAVWMRCKDSNDSPLLDSRKAVLAINDNVHHVQAIQFEGLQMRKSFLILSTALVLAPRCRLARWIGRSTTTFSADGRAQPSCREHPRMGTGITAARTNGVEPCDLHYGSAWANFGIVTG